MAANSAIEWTDTTWNPVTGCTNISTGCQNCYAERMSYRLQAMGQPNYADGFKVKTHKNVLSLPLKWKKPRTIFVNSMSDLFHEDVPASFISKVFEVMSKVTQHTFQVLTKRSENLRVASAIVYYLGQKMSGWGSALKTATTSSEWTTYVTHPQG